MKKAIVLGADNGYMDKLETTIKSVCAHNDHLKFYVFNDDIPSVWFRVMKERLKSVQSEIINVKISDHTLRNYRLAISYLSYAAYFRYFISDFVEEERALYLDCDTVVTGNLDELFSLELEDYMLAAVEDYYVQGYTGDFNSGMMLIPVRRWKEENVSQQLLDLTEKHHEHAFGDQGILNILFRDKWRKLSRYYNFMLGMDTLAQVSNDEKWYASALDDTELPLVLHYTGDKPWYHISRNRYRTLWWFYYSVEWSDVLLRKSLMHLNGGGERFNALIHAPLYHTAIFTDSCELEQIERLLEAFPQVHFSILAHTTFASNVIDLQRYENVSVYPGFTPFNFDQVMKDLDFYLDINYGGHVFNIVNRIHELNKPIFAFETTSHDAEGKSKLYKVDDIDGMITDIHSYLSTLE